MTQAPISLVLNVANRIRYNDKVRTITPIEICAERDYVKALDTNSGATRTFNISKMVVIPSTELAE